MRACPTSDDPEDVLEAVNEDETSGWDEETRNRCRQWLGGFGLTDREAHVTCSVLEGQTFAQVGAALGLATSTVKTYFSRALDKMGLESRQELLDRWSEQTLPCDAEKDDTSAPTSERRATIKLFSLACCPQVLFITALVLPLRMMDSGSVGLPVSLGCAAGLLAVSLARTRLPVGRASLVTNFTVVCVGAVALVVRLIQPIAVWLDPWPSFLTTAGLSACALSGLLSFTDEVTVASRGYSSIPRLVAICIASLATMIACASPFARDMVALVSCAFLSWAMLVPTVDQQVEPGPHMTEEGVPALAAYLVAALFCLGWCSSGSFGRPFTFGVPALVAVVASGIGIIAFLVTLEGTRCLGAVAIVGAAVLFMAAVGEPRQALVTLPLLLGVAASWDLAEQPGHGHSDETRGWITEPMLLAAAGVCAVEPPVASWYHSLATLDVPGNAAAPLAVAAISAVGCVSVLCLVYAGWELRVLRSAGELSQPDNHRRMRALFVSKGASETQADVLLAICEGKSGSEIEHELFLSRGTVNSARWAGYACLGVHSRAGLVSLVKSSIRDGEARQEFPRSSPSSS